LQHGRFERPELERDGVTVSRLLVNGNADALLGLSRLQAQTLGPYPA
jgi:hypothetical protein